MFTQPHWKQVWFQHSLQKSAANFFLQHIELATSKIPHAKAMEGPKTIYSAKGLLHAFAIGTGWKVEEKKKMKRREKLKKKKGKGMCFSPHKIKPYQWGVHCPTTEHTVKEQSASSQGFRENRVTTIYWERKALSHHDNTAKDAYKPAWGLFSYCPTFAWSSRRRAGHIFDRSHCLATQGSVTHINAKWEWATNRKDSSGAYRQDKKGVLGCSNVAN